MKFTYLATILDFQAVEHRIWVNKQFQIIPWYQKHMVWHQNEVSRSVTLRDISFLINAQIGHFRFYQKYSRVTAPHPQVYYYRGVEHKFTEYNNCIK